MARDELVPELVQPDAETNREGPYAHAAEDYVSTNLRAEVVVRVQWATCSVDLRIKVEYLLDRLIRLQRRLSRRDDNTWRKRD